MRLSVLSLYTWTLSTPRYSFFLMIPRPPISTLFPYTTLFRSKHSAIIKGSFSSAENSSRNTLGCLVCCELFSRSEEHTSELQSRGHLVCRLLLEKKKTPRPASGQRPRVSRPCPPALPSAR